jgi:hypothetical protein
VVETTKSGRAVGTSGGGGRGRLLVVGGSVALMLGSAMGGYFFGLDLASRDLVAAKELIQQLQPENQKLKRDAINQNAKFGALEVKLASVQAALDVVMPSENTYNINPNQSMTVADGRLVIGLIGSPTNESVNININGKQRSAATGDVINVALDPLTTCQVTVQSFDMFKAVVTAKCTAAKPR